MRLCGSPTEVPSPLYLLFARQRIPRTNRYGAGRTCSGSGLGGRLGQGRWRAVGAASSAQPRPAALTLPPIFALPPPDRQFFAVLRRHACGLWTLAAARRHHRCRLGRVGGDAVSGTARDCDPRRCSLPAPRSCLQALDRSGPCHNTQCSAAGLLLLADPADACTDLKPPPRDVKAPWVALIARSQDIEGCTFDVKVRLRQVYCGLPGREGGDHWG